VIWRSLLILLFGLLATPQSADATLNNQERYANTVRLRSAIESTGVQPGPDVDRKLAAMSDHEIERLVHEHQAIGYSGNPLTVIAGAIVLLVLVVLLLVAIVE
jgi:hypothetical protein